MTLTHAMLLAVMLVIGVSALMVLTLAGDGGGTWYGKAKVWILPLTPLLVTTFVASHIPGTDGWRYFTAFFVLYGVAILTVGVAVKHLPLFRLLLVIGTIVLVILFISYGSPPLG